VPLGQRARAGPLETVPVPPCVYGVAKRAHEWYSLALADLSSAGLAHLAAAPGTVTLATLATLWQLDVLEGLDHVRLSRKAVAKRAIALTCCVRVSLCTSPRRPACGAAG